MPRYALASHVFVCLQGEHVIFLDVREDRYFALEAAKTRELGSLVRGWLVAATQAEKVSTPQEDSPAVLSLLLQKDLLTEDATAGKDATPVDVTPLKGEFAVEGHIDSPTVGPLAFCRFLVSAIRASCVLRFCSFERVVQRVRNRNARRGPHASRLDAEKAHRLVATFASLRPFFFTAKDACLFEALALSEFLAAHGMFPSWVFGVQARPFAAHCWLQQDGIVFNDTVDHVGRYTPIMSV